VVPFGQEELPAQVLAAFNEHAGTKFAVAKWREVIADRARKHPELDLAAHRAIIEGNFAAPWWDTVSPSVIYGNAAQFERSMHADGTPRARTRADGVSENPRWLESLRVSDDELVPEQPTPFRLRRHRPRRSHAVRDDHRSG